MEAASTLAPAPMPQHMEALAHANRVRLARAALKRSVAAGTVGAAEIVRSCPWEVESMTVGELLRSQRRWGRTRVRKFLFSLSLNENRELAGQLLASWLAGPADGETIVRRYDLSPWLVRDGLTEWQSGRSDALKAEGFHELLCRRVEALSR